MLFLDKTGNEKGVHAKTVRFAYLPKYSTTLGSFYWTQINGKSILCTSEADSIYCWDFIVTEASIKSTLIYEYFGDSLDAIPIRNLRSEINLLDLKAKQFNVTAIEDWHEALCTRVVNSEAFQFDGELTESFSSSTKLVEIHNDENKTKLLAVGKRQISSLSLSKSNLCLSIEKSWTFRTDSIKILYEYSGTVLFLDAFGQLCCTDWAQQSTNRVIISESLTDALILSVSDDSVLLVTVSAGKVELMKLSCFTDIGDRVVLSDSNVIKQVQLSNSHIIIHCEDDIVVYRFQAKTDISSIVESKRTLPLASLYLSLVGDDFTYLVKEGQQYRILNLQEQCINLQVADSSFSSDCDVFGSLSYLGANLKSLFGSSISIFKETGHLVHLCRNSFGNVLDMKYLVIDGIKYFVCLHTNSFLIFSLKATTAGSIEPFLLKTVALPAGEFSSSRCNIAITGDSRIFIRNECNAYEINLDSELSALDWSKHGLDSSFKLQPSVMGLLQGQVIDEQLIELLCSNPADKHSQLLKSVLQLAANQQYAMDQFGFNALITILLHVLAKQQSLSLASIGDLKSYGLVCAFKSDSESLLVEQCLNICVDKLTFEWFEVFQFGFWVKNMETLVSLQKFFFPLTISIEKFVGEGCSYRIRFWIL